MTVLAGHAKRLATAVSDREHIEWGHFGEESGLGSELEAWRALKYLDQRARGTWSGVGHFAPSLITRPLSYALGSLFVLLAAAQGLIGFLSAWLWLPRSRENVPTTLLVVVMFAFLSASIWLFRTAPQDSRARQLALLFASVGSAVSISLQPQFESVPVLVAAAAWFLPESLLPYFLWSFVEHFPRISRYGALSALVGRARGMCLATGLTLAAVNGFYRAGLWDDDTVFVQAITFMVRQPMGPYWFLLFALALPAPFVALYRTREAPPPERRRTQVFILSLLLGFSPLFFGVLAELLIPAFHDLMTEPTARWLGSSVVYGFLLTVPLTTSITVRAKSLSIRPLFQTVARRALASTTLLLLTGASLLTLIFAVWLGRHESLAALAVSPRILLLTSIAILAPSLLLWRSWFVGSCARNRLGPSASQSLGTFARSLQAVRDLRELEQLIAVHAREMVAAPGARLLVFEDDTTEVAPISEGCRPLDKTSMIVALCRVPGSALPVGVLDSESVAPWLPEHERQWVAELEIELICPLIDALGEQVGLLLLDRRVDRGVYDSQAQRLAQALASTAQLALIRFRDERRSRAEAPSHVVDEEPAQECGACGKVAGHEAQHCSCGAELDVGVLPLIVRGKFQVECLLGTGGMGRVYRALDISLQRRVALKTLPRLRTSALLRLRQEARAMASFVNPNLALIFGVEYWRGIPILVVEYLEGGTLAESLTGRLSPTAAIELGVKLAAGLAAMHVKGLLHRDVKPSNIGFDAAGEPKLLDFGLAGMVGYAGIGSALEESVARERDRTGLLLTSTNKLLGTPMYLSPEVLRGGRFSEAEDIWSLHLVLWEALAGHHPLADLTFPEALDSIRKGKLPRIVSARPDCPERLAQVIDSGLGELSKRPLSAEGMQARLLSAL